MALTITLQEDINNTSLQIGDIAYYVAGATLTNSITNTTDSPEMIGEITGITGSGITIDDPFNTPPANAFIMFQKDRGVNNTSLLGYYAEVKLSNNSTEKAELFALNSGIAASSK
tara:strand:- start:1535 stop:1879 length:345 start_codon:yes stop_codon:yes gene_type:complete